MTDNSNDLLSKFELYYDQSQLKMVELAKQLEDVSTNELKRFTKDKTLSAFSNLQAMSDYAVLLLYAANESLMHGKCNIDEIRKVLELAIRTIQLQRIAFTQASKIGFDVSRKLASTKGRSAADARHSKPGGSRSKSEEMRRIWATGKYKSRDICAEQECAVLNIAFATARRALVGTPKPA